MKKVFLALLAVFPLLLSCESLQGERTCTIIVGLLLAAGLLAALFSASARQKPAQKGDVVRLVKAKSVQIITSEDDKAFRKAVDATFLHNDTYLICDTALWRVADNIINAKGHVRLMQEGS